MRDDLPQHSKAPDNETGYASRFARNIRGVTTEAVRLHATAFVTILLLVVAVHGKESAAADTATNGNSETLRSSVVSNYCNLVHAAYADTLRLAQDLENAVTLFLQKPDAASLKAAREAWSRCRSVYLQTEVARYYDGPIEAVEGFINAWPIDENYIDYNSDDPSAGIINQPEKFPSITRELLLNANENGGEKNISTGFHAIEFLLWGQGLSTTGPGDRPPADYVDDHAGRARHAGRRREYLRLVTAMLVEHLAGVAREWAPEASGNYRSKLLSLSPQTVLEKIVTGIGSLSGGELGGERLLVPYTTKEQEDEHSCFSDTTHLDLIHDEMAIQNVVLGSFTRADGSRITGPGLSNLIEQVDPKLAAMLKAQMDQSLTALKAIPPPFDQAITGRDRAPGRKAIKQAIDALQLQSTLIAKGAKALGLRFNVK